MHLTRTFPEKNITICVTILYIILPQLSDKLQIPVGLRSEVKYVLHLSQNIGNNFEVALCTLLNKLVSVDLYFRNVRQVECYLLEMWERRREQLKGFTASVRVPFCCQFVCYLFFFFFFFFLLFFFSFYLCFFVCSLSPSSPFKGATSV